MSRLALPETHRRPLVQTSGIILLHELRGGPVLAKMEDMDGEQLGNDSVTDAKRGRTERWSE